MNDRISAKKIDSWLAIPYRYRHRAERVVSRKVMTEMILKLMNRR